MIFISPEALDMLGQHVAVANTAGFLWRKLSESPTVENIGRQFPPAEIEEKLKELLAQDSLREGELTSAYCFLVALLLQGPHGVEQAEDVANIDKLPLAKSMIADRATASRTTSATVKQTPRLLRPDEAPSSSSPTKLLAEAPPPLRRAGPTESGTRTRLLVVRSEGS